MEMPCLMGSWSFMRTSKDLPAGLEARVPSLERKVRITMRHPWVGCRSEGVIMGAMCWPVPSGDLLWRKHRRELRPAFRGVETLMRREFGKNCQLGTRNCSGASVGTSDRRMQIIPANHLLHCCSLPTPLALPTGRASRTSWSRVASSCKFPS